MRRENWTKWDIFSRNDIKTKWYLNGFVDKTSAYGLFVWLVEEMYQTSDGWIEMDDMFLDITSQATGWEIENLKSAIARLISAKLFISEKTRFTSNRVLRQIFEWSKLSKTRADAGRKGAEKTNSSRQLLGKESAKGGKSLDKKRIDKKRIEEEATPPVLVLELPESLKSTEMLEAVSRWEKKLLSQGRTLDQLTLESQLMNLGLNKERILRAINFCCGLTRVKNLIEPEEKDSPKVISNGSQPRPSQSTYKPPTAEESRKPTAEEKARVKSLIEESLHGAGNKP